MPLSKQQERAAVILLSAGAGQLNLAGGSALIALGLVDRETKDVDAFTNGTEEQLAIITGRVAAAFVAAGFLVADTSEVAAVRRLMVTEGVPKRKGRPVPSVQIEMCTDFRALPAMASPLGPILDPRELGANKILAAYDRTRARDADDLARLIPVLGWQTMIDVANLKMVTAVDEAMLADSFRRFARIPDSEFPLPATAPAVKRYLSDVAAALMVRGVEAIRSPYAGKIK